MAEDFSHGSHPPVVGASTSPPEARLDKPPLHGHQCVEQTSSAGFQQESTRPFFSAMRTWHVSYVTEYLLRV